MSSRLLQAVNANASIRLGYAVNEADGSIAGGDSYKYGAYVNDITKDTWVEATHEFTLEANTKVNLVVMVGKNPGQSVLIDDFSLQTNDGGLIEGDEPEQPEEPGDAIFSEVSLTASVASPQPILPENKPGTQTTNTNV